MKGNLTTYEFYIKQDEDFANIFVSGLFGFGIIVPAVILLVILSACKKYKAVTVVAGFSALVDIVCAFRSLITFTSGGFVVFVILAAVAVGFIISAVSAYHTDKIETNMKYRPEMTDRTDENTYNPQQTNGNVPMHDDTNERGGGE